MTKRITVILALSLALITSACGSSMKTPDIKHNPNPEKRYEVTLTIDDAPGMFDSVQGYVLYQVAEDSCLPVQPGSGARLALRKNFPVLFQNSGGSTYTAVIFTDLLHDEDYYGLGICHWQVASSGAVIKLHNFSFNVGMDIDAIRSQRPALTYFSKESYSEAKANKVDTDNGTVRTAYVVQHPDEFFSATLTTREAVK
jgi:hypothetical protein